MELVVVSIDCTITNTKIVEKDVDVDNLMEKDLVVNVNHYIKVKEDINSDCEKDVFHVCKVANSNIAIETVYLEMEDLEIVKVVDCIMVVD